MGDEPKVSPIHLSLLSRSGLKANASLWWAIRSSVMDKLTHLAFRGLGSRVPGFPRRACERSTLPRPYAAPDRKHTDQFCVPLAGATSGAARSLALGRSD